MTEPPEVPRVSSRGVIGSRHLIAVQTFDVARLTTHPVPIVPGTFVAVSGEGPRGDSNGSGKTSFLVAVSILLGDPQWRFDTAGGKAAAGVLFRPDSAGVDVKKATPARSGYIVGVFTHEERPRESAITVWVHLVTSKPYFEAVWAEGVHLADHDDLDERDLQADAIWKSLKRRGTLSARRMAEVLYGDAPRCLTYLDTPLRPPAPSLLSQQMTEMEPKDIGESLIALSGSKAHLDAERKQRGDVLVQRRQRDDSLERAAVREREIAAELAAIEQRDAAREALAAAEACWDGYVAAQYRKVLEADAVAAQDIRALTEDYEEARGRAEAAKDDLDELVGATDLEAAERRAYEQWQQARERTSKFREQRAAHSESQNVLVLERNDLRPRADGWDGSKTSTTSKAVAAAERDLHRVEADCEAADAAVISAREAVERAETGRVGLAGLALDALADAEITGAALFDVLELDEPARSAWEPRINQYEHAVVVPHGQVSQARAALTDLPGVVLVATDQAKTSMPQGIRCSWAVASFLHELAERLEHRAEPDQVHDPALGVTIVGGFPDPIAGRDALLAQLRNELADAEHKASGLDAKLTLAQSAAVLATNRHKCAVAAERLRTVNEQERQVTEKISILDGEIRAATTQETENQDEWERARDAVSGRAGKIELLKAQHTRFRDIKRTRQEKLNTRKTARESLDVERWRVLAAACVPAEEAGEQTEALQLSGLGATRVKATEHLAHAMRLYGFDEGQESLPNEIRESIRARQQLAADSGNRAPRLSLHEIADPLRSRLESMAGTDRVTRKRIIEERAEQALIHEGIEDELRDSEARLEVLQHMISQRIEGILNRISVQFGQLDSDRAGNGADLHFTPCLPHGAAEWVWEVTPRWKRSHSGGMVSYKEIANGAQVKVYAVQLVLAAVLADAETHGRVLVLDELGNSLGEVNRKDVLGALNRVAEDTQVTILGTCQDSVVVDAGDVCGELLWFAHTSESEAYNRPTRVWGFTENGDQVELTANQMLSGRWPRSRDT